MIDLPPLNTPLGAGFVLAWLATLGGCIGSFMNVIVHRIPAGKSIVHPGSQCPHCGHAIRARDNIPVLSWFLLRGRCRDCKGTISFRYPLVEGTVALLFVLVGVVQVGTGGANLPGAAMRTGAGVLGVTVYHLVLLCGLLCIALIRYDGNEVRLRLIVPLVAVGFIAPMGAPLRPVSASGALSWAEYQENFFPAVATGALGCTLGVALGGLTGGTMRKEGWAKRTGHRSVAAGLVGIYLGWQAVLVVTLFTAVLYLVDSMVTRWLGLRPGVPWSAWLALASLAYILMWSSIGERLPAVVTAADGMTLAVGAASTLGLSIAARRVVRL